MAKSKQIKGRDHWGLGKNGWPCGSIDTPQEKVDYLAPTLQEEFDKKNPRLKGIGIDTNIDGIWKHTVVEAPIEEINKELPAFVKEPNLRDYFESIAKLADSGDEFPVDLNEVWMLVYTLKENAVRDLKQNFMQGIDYQVIVKNDGNPLGGRPENIYKLSVSCLEYFIARKVKVVFEVYRQVFHAVRRSFSIPQSFSEALRLAAAQQEQIELQSKQLALQEAKIELDKPKVLFAETVNTNKRAITMQEFSKILFDKNGIDIGRNDLFSMLLLSSYLFLSSIIMMGNFENELKTE